MWILSLIIIKSGFIAFDEIEIHLPNLNPFKTLIDSCKSQTTVLQQLQPTNTEGTNLEPKTDMW